MAGAMFQEAIDVAVVLNALRALGGRPTEIDSSPAAQIAAPRCPSVSSLSRLVPGICDPAVTRRGSGSGIEDTGLASRSGQAVKTSLEQGEGSATTEVR